MVVIAADCVVPDVVMVTVIVEVDAVPVVVANYIVSDYTIFGIPEHYTHAGIGQILSHYTDIIAVHKYYLSRTGNMDIRLTFMICQMLPVYRIILHGILV